MVLMLSSMKPLIRIDNSIEPHLFFTFETGKNKGKKLRISETESTGFNAIDTIETVKNITDNKYTKITRSVLKSLNPIINE